MPAASLLCLLLADCGGGNNELSPPPVEPSEARYWGTQLHLHGSFSEGQGTMEEQTRAAADLGDVDVLWWTDHDWRVARHTFLSHFDFESFKRKVEIPYRGMPWSKRPRYLRVGWKTTRGGAALVSEDQRLSDTAVEGKHSLRLAATAGPGEEWGWTGGRLDTNGGRWSRPLAAGVTLEIEVRPETQLGDDARLVVRTQLSRRAAGVGELRYTVGETCPPHEEQEDGRRVVCVALAAETGRWTRLRLPVSEDAARLGLGGADNSLRRIEIRLETRRGASAAVLLDDLELHEELDGPALLMREEQMAAELGAAHGVVEHVGLELSYALHMNAFLPKIELPDFARFPHGMAPREAVRWAHERGGVVAYNHIFGAGDDPEDDVKEELSGRGDLPVEERAFGADLLEVGYPQRVLPLAEHLAVWDRLSAAGVVITGIGSSDSHDPREGWTDGNNYLTWIHAASSGSRDLIEGLRCGRVFFGDPARFSGIAELSIGGRPVQGQILELTPGREATVEARVQPLPPDCRIRWISGGQVVREEPVLGEGYDGQLVVTGGETRFVRLEVWQGERGLVFTNPLYLASPGFTPAMADGDEPPVCRRAALETSP
ncbi:MAG: CehA/McbA family metallohydrolase [Acidobacteria bacterium]|nr:CehA/McbA family metallohydrolase [Acidobacteriota bacterium]